MNFLEPHEIQFLSEIAKKMVLKMADEVAVVKENDAIKMNYTGRAGKDIFATSDREIAKKKSWV